MGLTLLKHQQAFKEKNPDKALLCWEGGTGKTIGASVWLKQGRDDCALVICPKRIVKKWEEELTKWGTKAMIVSKEQFKKIDNNYWSAIVVDEADEFASPLFMPAKRSQLSEHLYNLIKFRDVPILLLTATPIRSTPWNLHTLMAFTGYYFDWKKWRELFFSLERRPYLAYAAWLPKSDWRERIRPFLKAHADIVLLKDCVDDIPPIVEEVIQVPSGEFVSDDWEAVNAFVAEHRHEQKNKAKKILELGKEYRKVLVVAHYVEQTEQLLSELSKDRKTYMVNGSVKDQESILTEANKCDECYLIVQASLGAGFDADSFSCVIFASMSYRIRDWVQMKYRVRRIHNLHPVIYYYLIGGRCDRAVYKQINLGKEFVPSEWNPYVAESSENEES